MRIYKSIYKIGHKAVLHVSYNLSQKEIIVNEFREIYIPALEKLNQKLTKIEAKIYDLAKYKFQSTQKRRDELTDFEIDIEITLYSGDKEILILQESLKNHFNGQCKTNLNDGENHNVTSSIITNEALNTQQHCWLLHRLYDDYNISWKRILTIDRVWFDIIERVQCIVKMDEI